MQRSNAVQLFLAGIFAALVASDVGYLVDETIRHQSTTITAISTTVLAGAVLVYLVLAYRPSSKS